MGIADLFNGTYHGRRVFLTGHTGFKGSWLALWLAEMGAELTGYALAPETEPAHLPLLGLPMHSVLADIRDQQALTTAMQAAKPEIVFHLAAQPLVIRSYQQPAETYATNVMGTLHLLEACRAVPSVKAIVLITTDKVYENHEWPWPYREQDRLGGYDPYSSSKACTEILASSWRNSFFAPAEYGKSHTVLMATARAGNVIGGGDWSAYRLIPDMVRANLNQEPVVLRRPDAVRPWQHVLEPVGAYLLLGQALLEGRTEAASAWNIGPNPNDFLTVEQVVRLFDQHWPLNWRTEPMPYHEAGLLTLDISAIRARLGWQPRWNAAEAVAKTAAWYAAWHQKEKLLSREQLYEYVGIVASS